ADAAHAGAATSMMTMASRSVFISGDPGGGGTGTAWESSNDRLCLGTTVDLERDAHDRHRLRRRVHLVDAPAQPHEALVLGLLDELVRLVGDLARQQRAVAQERALDVHVHPGLELRQALETGVRLALEAGAVGELARHREDHERALRRVHPTHVPGDLPVAVEEV